MLEAKKMYLGVNKGYFLCGGGVRPGKCTVQLNWSTYSILDIGIGFGHTLECKFQEAI